MSLEALKANYIKQFGREFPLLDNVEYHATRPLPKDEVLDIYERRYRSYKIQKKSENAEYELLLNNIRFFKGLNITVHVLIHATGATLLFTDDLNTFIIGILFSPYTDKTD